MRLQQQGANLPKDSFRMWCGHRSDFRTKEGGVGEATDLDACLRKSGGKSKEGQGQEQALLERERYKQKGKKQQAET